MTKKSTEKVTQGLHSSFPGEGLVAHCWSVMTHYLLGKSPKW